MKTAVLMTTLLIGFAASAAPAGPSPQKLVFNCGALLYRGEPVIGIPEKIVHYTVTIDHRKNQIILSSASTERMTTSSVMVKEAQFVEGAAYTAGDIRVTTAYLRGLHVNIERISNPDWSASCIRQ